MNEKILERGKIGGAISVILFVFPIILSIWIALAPGLIALEIATFILSIVLTIAYTLLLLAILEIAKHLSDDNLARNVKSFIGINLVVFPLIAVFSFLSHFSMAIQTVLNLAALPFICAVGIISIRLSRDFYRLENQIGPFSQKAAKWLKISGYLMATIILYPIGGLLSFFADYYMWKTVKAKLEKQ